MTTIDSREDLLFGQNSLTKENHQRRSTARFAEIDLRVDEVKIFSKDMTDSTNSNPVVSHCIKESSHDSKVVEVEESKSDMANISYKTAAIKSPKEREETNCLAPMKPNRGQLPLMC